MALYKQNQKETQQPQKPMTSIPEPPKRSLSSFFLYKKEVYDKVKKEQPQLAMTEITKVVSERWKKEERSVVEKFQKIAKKEKEVYDQVMAKYREKYGDQLKKKKKEEKKAKKEKASKAKGKKSK